MYKIDTLTDDKTRQVFSENNDSLEKPRPQPVREKRWKLSFPSAGQSSLNPSALIPSSSPPPSPMGAGDKGPIWKAFSRASETHRAGECFDVYRDVSCDVTDRLQSTGGQSAVSGEGGGRLERRRGRKRSGWRNAEPPVFHHTVI